MNVKLVWATPEGDQLIAKMARVSNPANENNDATAPKLIKYLINHAHWSPFEMASLCVEIETERDVAAQILRHRSFSFQEFSQRYAQAPLPVVPALRRQDLKNRQNSTDDLPEQLVERYQEAIARHNLAGYDLYQSMLDAGVAKECARRVLPLSTPTRMYMSGTVRSWIHYFKVRCDPATQLEHREVADAIRRIFVGVYPAVAAATGNNYP
jgi:thymidylate synthase (FAD)